MTLRGFWAAVAALGSGLLPVYGKDESWSEVLDTVFMTAVRVSQEVMPILKAAGRGAVVHVASASVNYYNARTAQCAEMKAAVAHVTKNWARDGAPHGVRVNAVLLGWIRGARITQSLEEQAQVARRPTAALERELVIRPDVRSGRGAWGFPPSMQPHLRMNKSLNSMEPDGPCWIMTSC